MNKHPVKVSVALITYNHAPYIRQALDSVLMQKTDFPFEIVIGEDCSMDGTREIINKYRNKYPELIRIVTAENNVGATKNVIRTLESCQEKYIALLEGDDFWVDQHKLQRQVDFMEKHQDFNLCIDDCSVINERGNLVKKSRVPTEIKKKGPILNYSDLLYYTPPTVTVLFRNKREIIQRAGEVNNASDHFLFYVAAQKMKVYYNQVISAAHRQNSKSTYNPLSPSDKIQKHSLPNLNELSKMVDKSNRKEKKALAYGYAIAYANLFLFAYDAHSSNQMKSAFNNLIRYDLQSHKPLLPITLFRLFKRGVKRLYNREKAG